MLTRPLSSVVLRTSLLLLIVGEIWTDSTCAGDESRQVAWEWVANSSLPSGPGIAADYVADEQIDSHAAVIFADNFEVGELGAKWDQDTKLDDRILKVVDDSAASNAVGRHSLQVTATLGQNTGGGLTKWFSSAERLNIRFYTKFDAQCDYVHHFCTLRANRSLQGGDRWSGFGGAGVRPDGARRFSTAIEPWGNWGRWNPPGRWNFYSYWHTMQVSPDGKFWGNSFRPEMQAGIERGRWISVEMMLLHNTPGQDDGEQAYWIDGQLRGHWRGINWRTDAQLMANALTVESYITDRWTKQHQNIVYFDNVVIAREYIGPAGDGNAPAGNKPQP